MQEIIELLENMGTICQVASSGGMNDELKSVLVEGVEYVNEKLYGAKYTIHQTCQGIPSKDDEGIFIKETASMLSTWSESVRSRVGKGDMDRRFAEICDRYRHVSAEDILHQAIQTYKNAEELTRKKIEFNVPQMFFLCGNINEKDDDYTLVSAYVDMMKSHVDDFIWLYNRLCDNRSRFLLLEIINYWTTFDLDHLLAIRENLFKDYYDLDILPEMKDEVFVDCGAYYGDSIIDLTEVYGPCYRKIYAYEMVEESFQAMQQVIGQHDNIVLRKAGVGEKRGTLYIDDETAGMGSRLADSGKVAVEVVPIDEDIEEPVTVIKMDIEGAEIDALKGARRHITEDAPKLLISAYHKPADIFEIPKLICEMRDDYDLYLRLNGEAVWPADFVVFAIPR